MMPSTDFLSLVNNLYERVRSPDDWPAGLAAIDTHFRSRTSQIYFQPDPASHPLLNVPSPSTNPRFAEEYARDYAALDPRLTAIPALVGKAVRCVDILPIEEMERSPVTTFLDHPEVDARWCLAAPFQINSSGYGFVVTMRPRSRGTYDDDEVAAFQSLSPHVRRIVELHMRFGELKDQAALTEGALHAIETAIVLTDASARIVFTNMAADILFRSTRALGSSQGILCCRNAADTTALRQLIHEIARGGEGGVTEPDNVRLLPREDGLPPLVSVVLRLPFQHTASMRGRAGVAVFLLDPLTQRAPPTSLLRKFGCSEAEARLAAALAMGGNLGEIADRLRLSRETLRTQLAQLFRKTDTSRQAELVAFLDRCFSLTLRK